MTAAHLLKRIPRIKFPQRHLKHSGSVTEQQATSSAVEERKSFFNSSEVPAPPKNTAFGGKASLQPKRTPVSQHEIDAILLGGCF